MRQQSARAEDRVAPQPAASLADLVQARKPRLAPVKPAEEESGVLATLIRTIERLEETLEQETAGLRSRAPIDLKDFNNRKTHGLLELTRVMRHLDRGSLTPPVASRLSALRISLEVNQRIVKMHLEAVREVSTILADAIQEAESDGTYSVSVGRPAQRP
jgi:hypothetical protein